MQKRLFIIFYPTYVKENFVFNKQKAQNFKITEKIIRTAYVIFILEK